MKPSAKRDDSLYENARSVAEHYGFVSLQKVLDQASAARGGKKIALHPPKDDVPGDADRLSLMHAYLDYNFASLSSPLMLYHSEPLSKKMDREAYGGKNAVQFSLEVIGTSRSIAEATLFKTTASILKESGFENFSVTINSLGDKDSIARFVREFTNYYRKRMEEVPAHCRALFKKDVFKVLECAEDKCMLVKEGAPKPIATLTEESRNHFSEVLEFLESMNVPYSINNCLIGGKEYYTRTIFEIKAADETNSLFPKVKFDPVLARGGRYDDLSRRLGCKKEIPAVGMSISLGGLGFEQPKKAQDKVVAKKSSVYLIHLGFSAKQQSLSAIEILRKAKIQVHQSLSKDRISVQVAAAEKMNVPYTIIIGQKEAIEGTAIIRNMGNRSQETIPLPELPGYIRRFVKFAR